MKNTMIVNPSEKNISFLSHNELLMKSNVIFTPNSKKTSQWGKAIEGHRVISDPDRRVEALLKELSLGNIKEVSFESFPHLKFYPQSVSISFNSIPDLINKFQIFFEDLNQVAIPHSNPDWSDMVDLDFYLSLSDSEKNLILSVNSFLQISDYSLDLYPLEENLNFLNYEAEISKFIIQDSNGVYSKSAYLSLKDLVAKIKKGEIILIRYSECSKIFSIDPEGIWEFGI